MSNTRRLDSLPWEERKQFCYCKQGQTHCGTCSCGKPGHTRSLMMCTLTWCDDCYELAVKRLNDVEGDGEGDIPQALLAALKRRDHQYQLGYNAEHDDAYTHGELVLAAQSYLEPALPKDGHPHIPPPKQWPWDVEYWRPSSTKACLEKAIALIAAEWDRIDREDKRKSNPADEQS